MRRESKHKIYLTHRAFTIGTYKEGEINVLQSSVTVYKPYSRIDSMSRFSWPLPNWFHDFCFLIWLFYYVSFGIYFSVLLGFVCLFFILFCFGFLRDTWETTWNWVGKQVESVREVLERRKHNQNVLYEINVVFFIKYFLIALGKVNNMVDK